MNLDEFRYKVQKYCQSVGYSQEQLAAEMGLNPVTLSKKLNGRSELNKYEVKTIIRLFAEWMALTRTEQITELLELIGLEPGMIFSEKDWTRPPLAGFQIFSVEQKTQQASPAVISYEMTEGAMNVNSPFYIERDVDREALRAIEKQDLGVTITIKGPRQMGKSSLLMRLIDTAIRRQKRVAFFDFQLLEAEAITNSKLFFRQFLLKFSRELGLENRLDDYWDDDLSLTECCTEYVQNYLLKNAGAPVVLAIDEVDVLLNSPFGVNFFSMVRSWFNRRAYPTLPIWKQLDVVLITSTEPYLLIKDLNQSPFNVGLVIDLVDFTRSQVAELNRRHESLLNDAHLDKLYDLLEGHPYLTRRALYVLVSQKMPVAQFLETAATDTGPFANHLRYHHHRLLEDQGKNGLIKYLKQVIKEPSEIDQDAAYRLLAAGLVRRSKTRERLIVSRCPLYTKYFQEHL